MDRCVLLMLFCFQVILLLSAFTGTDAEDRGAPRAHSAERFMPIYRRTGKSSLKGPPVPRGPPGPPSPEGVNQRRQDCGLYAAHRELHDDGYPGAPSRNR